MANQTITTSVNYDDASIGGLLDGEQITINGGALTIDADTRWNQQAALFGNITPSSTLGGSVLIDGAQVWEVPFASSSGNVPTQAALGSNAVTGGTSGAVGELTRVWAAGSFDPATAGAAMPAAGFIKLRSKTGNFQAGETITLPGGATIVATNAGKRGVIQVVARTVGTTSVFMAVPRLSSCTVNGDWYYFDDLTNGADNQTFTLPVREELGGIQIETAPGSGVYEWYSNAGDTWNGHFYINENLAVTNSTLTRNAVSAFPYPAAERLRETAVAGVHSAAFALGGYATSFPSGAMKVSARLKQDTRRYVVVQFATNGSADRYGVLVDLVAGTIIATPTVGSPTGTSSSITSLGGGLYEVQVTINHTGAGQTGQVTVATSDSATPTYTNGLPTFTGNAAEGVYIALSRVEMATFSFIPTDVRGKFCGVDPIAGTVQLALRGANNSGFKPPSGCKVRIPNVFLSTVTPADHFAPMIISQNTRYYFQAGVSGGPTIKGAVMNWFNTGTAIFQDSCTTQSIASSIVTSMANVCVGVGLSLSVGNALGISGGFSGSVTDSRFTRRQSSVLGVSASTNLAFRRCRFEVIANYFGLSQRTSATQITTASLGLSNFVFEDCESLNGVITIPAGFSNGVFKNLKYADVMTGSTPAIGSSAINSQGTNMSLDGFSALGGLPNIHPYSAIVTVSGYYFGLSVANIGTPTAPYDCGSANPMGLILNGGFGSDTKLRRIYTANNRIGIVSFTTGAPLFEMFDVWGTGSQFIDLSGPSIIGRGGRYSNLRRGFSACSGTHWDDAYNSTTTGRITVMANEPTAASASQFSATLGTGSGYTGSGTIVVSNLTDELVWTSPYRFYGHTAFGGGGSCGGTDVQNLIWEYKIDTGSGFGSNWTFLANTVRTAGASPADGATTVTMNSADRAALTRQPQIGDFIQHSTFRLPQNTTITNIVGDVITVSNPFVSSILGGSGTISFSPVNVAVSPSNGYRLQIRCRPTVAAATTLTTGFSAGIQTNATDQQIPHPLPGSLVNISNLIPQSRVKVSRVDTGAILQQASCGAGTTLAFDFQYAGAVRVEARNASGTPAYKPWFTQVSISSVAAANIVALQELDQ
jgi:hypothetical protein